MKICFFLMFCLSPVLLSGFESYRSAFRAGEEALRHSRPSEAERCFAEAGRLANTPSEKARAILSEARSLERQKKLHECEEKLQSLLSLEDATPQIRTLGYKSLGFLHQKQGAYDRAMDFYRRGIEQNANDWSEIQTRLSLANLLLDRRPGEALALYRSVLSDPKGSGVSEKVQALFGLARCHRKTGARKEALEAFEAVLRVPGAPAWFRQEAQRGIRMLRQDSFSGNLIRNPSFEGVEKDGTISGFSSGLTRSEDSVHGNYSARFDGSGAHGTYVFQRGIELRPHTCYRFSASLKCDTDRIVPRATACGPYSEGVMAIVFPENNDWRERSATLLLRGGRQGWTRKSCFFQTGSERRKVWIGLYVLGTSGSAWFDHLELVECSPEEYRKGRRDFSYTPAPGENLLYNGSFEITTNPDLPDGIYNGIGEPWWKKDPRPWGSQLKIETENTPCGSKHLYLSNHTYLTFPESCTGKGKWTLSFLAKSDSPGGAIRVFWGGFQRVFPLGTEWKEYSATLEPNPKRSPMGFSDSAGKGVHLDAVMLTPGERVFPYAKSDRELCNEFSWRYRETPFFAPGTRMIEADGRGIRLAGTRPTELSVLRKDERLLLRIRCADTGPVCAGDSVLVRFLGLPEKENTCHADFKVFAGGKSQSDFPFTARVERGDSSWTALLEIPLASAAANRRGADIWGFNLMRVSRETADRKKEIVYLNGEDINDFLQLKIGANRTGNLLPAALPEPPSGKAHTRTGESRVSLNGAKHMLAVDGKPRIPFVLSYTQYPRFPATVDEVKAIGFDTVALWNIGNRPAEHPYSFGKQRKDMEAIGKKGLFILPHLLYGKSSRNIWSSREFPLEEILQTHAEAQKALKDLPCILAWATLDEIYGSWAKGKFPKQEKEIAKVTALLRKGDDRPVFGNVFHGGNAYGGVANFDIVSASLYTIRDTGGVEAFCNGAKSIMDHIRGKKSGAVGGAWIQYYNGSGEGGSREPSVPELSAMIYGGLIHGLRMFQFFQDRPNSNALWFGTAGILSEIRHLTPVFYSGESVPCASNHSKVICAAYRTEDAVFLISQNLAYSPLRGITLTAGGTEGISAAEAVFENRTCPVRDGSVTDSFAPLERHVYRFPVHRGRKTRL